ncbi:MAG: GatB/YqeY domain-containing protein [Muribaculaceae bacterium]|nr:GatB/YqeY domain-containing protein [Muribaculaceae bacterium]
MDLFETINSAIKAAMLAKDKVRLQALRGIKKEFIEAKTAPGSNGELSDDAAMKILVKMAKQRSESAEIYRQQNRPDLAETEEAEMAVIKEYLPQPLSADELNAALSEIIARTGAASPADMGKVMGVATKELAGRADGKAISAAVRQLLSK